MVTRRWEVPGPFLDSAAIERLRTELGLTATAWTPPFEYQASSETLGDWAAIAPADKQDTLTPQAAIANATGGATVDAEARAAVNAVLAALRTWGLIAP